MENSALKIIMENNPNLSIEQISKTYNFDKQRVIDYQLRSIGNCSFSRMARERDYDQAIKDITGR